MFLKNWSGAAYAAPLRLTLHIFLPRGLFRAVLTIWGSLKNSPGFFYANVDNVIVIGFKTYVC